MTPTPPDHKLCPRCKQLLPASRFGHNKSLKDGLSCYCLLCRSEYEKHRLRIMPTEQYKRVRAHKTAYNRALKLRKLQQP